MEPLARLHCNGRLLAMPTYIKQGGSEMEVANALAYCEMAMITGLRVL
jgi:hypothetical protein